jgi:hypothetical protein
MSVGGMEAELYGYKVLECIFSVFTLCRLPPRFTSYLLTRTAKRTTSFFLTLKNFDFRLILSSRLIICEAHGKRLSIIVFDDVPRG